MPCRNYRISVNAEHIGRAIPGNSTVCAIADAIKDQVPSASHIQVDIAQIRFSNPTDRIRYVWATPLKAGQFIVDFDSGNHEALRPFSFVLDEKHANKFRMKPWVSSGKKVKPTEKASLSPEAGASDNKSTSRPGGTRWTNPVTGKQVVLPKLQNFGSANRRRFGRRGLAINHQEGATTEQLA